MAPSPSRKFAEQHAHRVVEPYLGQASERRRQRQVEIGRLAFVQPANRVQQPIPELRLRYSVLHVYPLTLRPVMDLIRSGADRPARAARKRQLA